MSHYYSHLIRFIVYLYTATNVIMDSPYLVKFYYYIYRPSYKICNRVNKLLSQDLERYASPGLVKKPLGQPWLRTNWSKAGDIAKSAATLAPPSYGKAHGIA